MSIGFTKSLSLRPGSELINKDGITKAVVLSKVTYFQENGVNRFSLIIGTGSNPDENEQKIYNDTTEWFVPVNPDLLKKFMDKGTHIELSTANPTDFLDLYI